MKEPERLSHDDDAPPELRALLRAAHRARPLDPAVRERAGARIARAAAFPIAVAGWLSAKTAIAALSVGFGTAVVALVALRPEPEPTPRVAPAALASNGGATRGATPAARVVPAAAPSAPDPSASSLTSGNVGAFGNAPADSPPVAVRAAAGRPSSSSQTDGAQRAGELAAESALLERARSALRRAPSEALALAREHAERFPRGQLGAERALIEIDALYRLGRDQEAQNLAQAWLARNHDDLHVERVRQLLGKLSPN